MIFFGVEFWSLLLTHVQLLHTLFLALSLFIFIHANRVLERERQRETERGSWVEDLAQLYSLLIFRLDLIP